MVAASNAVNLTDGLDGLAIGPSIDEGFYYDMDSPFPFTPEILTEIEGETTVLELRVAPEDMGKLIGRQGRIAKEIRTIVKSVAQRNGQKVSVEIVD